MSESMDNETLLKNTLQQMRAAGFDRAQIGLSESDKHEFNIHHGEIKLLRTGLNKSLNLTGISQQRKASLSINRLDALAIEEAIEQLVQMAEGAQADAAYDIAPAQDAGEFSTGPIKADYDTMYDRLQAFADYCETTYPTTILEEATLDFTASRSRVINSNGIDFTLHNGMYGFVAMFTSKDGEATSSFNYSGYSAQNLDAPLWQKGHMDQLLAQSAEQVHTQQIPEKFSGPVIITPHCLEDFTGFLEDQISTGPLIADTSIYKGKVGQQVASDKLTIHCKPLSDQLADGYWLTGDGIRAQDLTLVENGKLNSYLLGIYGANKTGLPRSINDGGATIIEPGNTELAAMISGIEKGLLLCRFSGGSPNDKGDFSGVAKNSYYIENGKIAYAVSETMVSGNMAQLLMDIDQVSSETVDFGSSIVPWVRVKELTIS
ncbi:TldD/PmbA family protein [Pelagibaculum spongiae]|uniref:Peptidase n=1 Tax=Pelagibaculum spongiae TaxID=2080658 RepID=A0A2V1GV38_9GAMM|nr:metallopeptidase TldD-related protein [Pelagibaculum spongiae]PVZ63575.1 peptidase [Pelagibaculum spongiae]